MFARTPRLLLRPGWSEDAPALYEAIRDQGIVRNLATAPWPYQLSDAEAFLARERVAGFRRRTLRSGKTARQDGVQQAQSRASRGFRRSRSGARRSGHLGRRLGLAVCRGESGRTFAAPGR